MSCGVTDEGLNWSGALVLALVSILTATGV